MPNIDVKTAPCFLGLGLVVLLTAVTPALAEGDAPFFSENRQDFDNNYAKYKSDQGFVTNFDKELFPINPFGNDGKLYFRRDRVPTTGTGVVADCGACST